MDFYSQIIHRFDKTFLNLLKNEINVIKHSNLWTNHFEGQYAKTGALRYGKTFWLRKIDHNMNLLLDRCIDWPESNKIIKTYSQNNSWGRSYWHWLKPGDSIDRHHDKNLGFSDKVLHRYQVYLDVPLGCEIWIDEGKFDSRTLGNCVLNFNMYYEHYYKNNSDQDLIFMVFDVFKNGIDINYV